MALSSDEIVAETAGAANAPACACVLIIQSTTSEAVASSHARSERAVDFMMSLRDGTGAGFAKA
jgi:hypothetical protein